MEFAITQNEVTCDFRHTSPSCVLQFSEEVSIARGIRGIRDGLTRNLSATTASGLLAVHLRIQWRFDKVVFAFAFRLQKTPDSLKPPLLSHVSSSRRTSADSPFLPDSSRIRAVVAFPVIPCAVANRLLPCLCSLASLS